MNKVRLVFNDMVEIVGSDGFSAIRLTDVKRERAITIVCDKAMTEQLLLRIQKRQDCSFMLPEVLIKKLYELLPAKDFELTILAVLNGQYQVMLTVENVPYSMIRMSDAMLLHIITQMPLYAEETVMKNQSSAYVPDSSTRLIPINCMTSEQLDTELKRAVEEENYQLAAELHAEIQRRNKT